jgi:hypothetical protein
MVAPRKNLSVAARQQMELRITVLLQWLVTNGTPFKPEPAPKTATRFARTDPENFRSF